MQRGRGQTRGGQPGNGGNGRGRMSSNTTNGTHRAPQPRKNPFIQSPSGNAPPQPLQSYVPPYLRLINPPPPLYASPYVPAQSNVPYGSSQPVNTSSDSINARQEIGEPPAQGRPRPRQPSPPLQPRYEDEYTFEVFEDNPLLLFAMGRTLAVSMDVPLRESLAESQRLVLEAHETLQIDFVSRRDNDTARAARQRQEVKELIRAKRGRSWGVEV